jgi:membrane-associated HD superfamily phosphohydrolase
LTTLFIVYLFPKTGKFRYSFEKGKPWQSENLYAPFNFAIKKSQNELDKKKLEIENNSPIYFEVNEAIEPNVLSDYILRFNQTIKDSSYLNIQNSDLFIKGKSFVDDLYDKGVLDQDYSYSDNRPVILATSNTILKELEYGSLYEFSELRALIENDLDSYVSEQKRNKMISIYFDVIKSNITLNESLTQKALEEELTKISSTRGSIEQDQLIISKGQVVEDEQYTILNSLKSEYESQVWNTANYNWVLVAYTLLVALALLMLLLLDII